MKKLKSIFLKIKSKVTITAHKRPLLLTIIFLLFLNLVVVFIGSIIAFNIAPERFDYSWINALVAAFKWIISVHSINDFGDDLRLFVVAIVTVCLGLVLFSGATIATLTAALRALIEKLSKARGKINLDNHFVILNWNSKVPELVNNLLVKGFKDNVIILSNKDKEFVTTQINSVIEKGRNKLNLIVKEGNPLVSSTLEDISIERASHIVVMSREDLNEIEDKDIRNADLQSLKVVLGLSDFKYKNDISIVVELVEESAIEKIKKLSETLNNMKDKSIIPVSFRKKIGQLIANTVLTPDISNVYFDLLSYEGVEFYPYSEESVDEYLSTHSEAIPIIKYDKLFVVAEDEKCLDVKRENISVQEQKLSIKDYERKESCTVFVIGNNTKKEFVMDNLNLSASYRGARLVVKNYEKHQIQKLIKDIKAANGIKNVIILSDDSVSSDSYDANVFVTLIALQTEFPDRKNLNFITELLDSKNLNCVKDFKINNAIISNKIISLLLTQLALNKNSSKFFENLFIADSEDGGEVFDINVSYAKDIIKFKNELVFSNKAEFIHSFYHSFNKDCMPIGYIRGNERIYISSHQDEEAQFIIKPDDKIIYINY